MTERQALMRAVCDNPDDDTPRLIFADWLDENGDETDRVWAQFIRLQCQLARMGEGSWNPGDEEAWATLLAQTDRLFDANRAAWEARLYLRSGLDPGTSDWGDFRRGFSELLAICGAAMPRISWDRVYSASPIRELSLTAMEHAEAALVHPEARRLRRLTLAYCDLSARDIQTLTGADTLRQLESLSFRTYEGSLTPETERLLRGRFGPVLDLELSPLRL